MSVVRLLKDHPKYGRAGTVADRVPFLEARDLVAAGAAERPGEKAAEPKPAPVAAPVPDGAFAELKAAYDALRAEFAALRTELAALKADHEALKKENADLLALIETEGKVDGKPEPKKDEAPKGKDKK